MRKIVSIAVLAAALLAGKCWAIDPAGLYAGRTIVTGTLEPERGKGLRRIMLDVLIKAAAEPRLAEDPRLPALLERAPDYATGFEYEDRMKGTPVRDEQGTRDRPHDLTASFDPAKIDAALRELGLQPWNANRPVIAMSITIEYPNSRFTLTPDGNQGLGQREALIAAADRRGVRIGWIAFTAVTPVPPNEPAREKPERNVLTRNETVTLRGTLRWQPEKAQWQTDWTLAQSKVTTANQNVLMVNNNRSWTVETPSFDEAFLNGVGEAAATLAGRR